MNPLRALNTAQYPLAFHLSVAGHLCDDGLQQPTLMLQALVNNDQQNITDSDTHVHWYLTSFSSVSVVFNFSAGVRSTLSGRGTPINIIGRRMPSLSTGTW